MPRREREEQLRQHEHEAMPELGDLGRREAELRERDLIRADARRARALHHAVAERVAPPNETYGGRRPRARNAARREANQQQVEVEHPPGRRTELITRERRLGRRLTACKPRVYQ